MGGPCAQVCILLATFVISGLGGDSGCDVGYQCLSRDVCVSYQSKFDDLQTAKKLKGKKSLEYQAILTRLKSYICNEKERKVCCDKSKQSKATTTSSSTTSTTTTTTTTTSPYTFDKKSWPTFVPDINANGECGLTGDAAFILSEYKHCFCRFSLSSLRQMERTRCLVSSPGSPS